MKMGTSPVLTKWKNWLTDIIEEDVRDLVLSKHTFLEVSKIFNDNPELKPQNLFYGYLGRTYTSHMAIVVRRQVKIGKDSISFARLLQEMVDNPNVVTRKYFVGLYKNSGAKNYADSDFNKFADSGSAHIKPSLVCDDLSKLRLMAKRCEDFADKRVAHRDKRQPKELPTYNELDDVVDFFDGLYCKYCQLLTGAGMESLLPIIQYDWKEIFRIPWIPNGSNCSSLKTDEDGH